jgi:integrase
MAFLTDVTKLKDDLILFRRGDVQHSRWYCRMKVPGVDRYKTVALKIESLREAQDNLDGLDRTITSEKRESYDQICTS